VLSLSLKGGIAEPLRFLFCQIFCDSWLRGKSKVLVPVSISYGWFFFSNSKLRRIMKKYHGLCRMDQNDNENEYFLKKNSEKYRTSSTFFMYHHHRMINTKSA
jgi:hypothetical protein